MNANELIDLIARINRSRRPLYLVGGAVRDRLIAREPHDLDFTAEGNIRPLAVSLADRLGAGFYPLDEERGTYRVVLDGGRTMIDFASLRGLDLRADLLGRDFTINAMALEIDRPEEVIDPLDGQTDLRERRLRACSSTSISDDPARALRAVRLGISLGLDLDSRTLEWVKAGASLLARISPERVRDELFRMFETPNSAGCLRLLVAWGLAAPVLPELEALRGVTQSPPHIYPVWEHTLEVLERLDALWASLVEPGEPVAPTGPFMAQAVFLLGRYREQIAGHFANRIVVNRSLRALVTFAALYHDCAKPLARSVDPDSRIRFLGHDEQGARMAANRARALAFSGEETTRVQTIIAGHMRIHQLSQGGQKPSARAIYRFFRDTGLAGMDLCLLTLADTWATYGHTLTLEHWLDEVHLCRVLMEARWERAEELVSPPRLLDGHDLIRVLGIKPGPVLGRMLEAVREAQVEGAVSTREEALEFIRRVGEDLV